MIESGLLWTRSSRGKRGRASDKKFERRTPTNSSVSGRSCARGEGRLREPNDGDEAYQNPTGEPEVVDRAQHLRLSAEQALDHGVRLRVVHTALRQLRQQLDVARFPQRHRFRKLRVMDGLAPTPHRDRKDAPKLPPITRMKLDRPAALAT